MDEPSSDTLSLPLTTMNDAASNSTLPPLDDGPRRDDSNPFPAAAAAGMRTRIAPAGNAPRSRRILYANYDEQGNDADHPDDGAPHEEPPAEWISSIQTLQTQTAAANTGNDTNNNDRSSRLPDDLRISMRLWEQMFDMRVGGDDMLFDLTDSLCCPLCMVKYSPVGGSDGLRVEKRTVEMDNDENVVAGGNDGENGNNDGEGNGGENHNNGNDDGENSINSQISANYTNNNNEEDESHASPSSIVIPGVIPPPARPERRRGALEDNVEIARNDTNNNEEEESHASSSSFMPPLEPLDRTPPSEIRPPAQPERRRGALDIMEDFARVIREDMDNFEIAGNNANNNNNDNNNDEEEESHASSSSSMPPLEPLDRTPQIPPLALPGRRVDPLVIENLANAIEAFEQPRRMMDDHYEVLETPRNEAPVSDNAMRQGGRGRRLINIEELTNAMRDDPHRTENGRNESLVLDDIMQRGVAAQRQAIEILARNNGDEAERRRRDLEERDVVLDALEARERREERAFNLRAVEEALAHNRQEVARRQEASYRRRVETAGNEFSVSDAMQQGEAARRQADEILARNVGDEVEEAAAPLDAAEERLRDLEERDVVLNAHEAREQLEETARNPRSVEEALAHNRQEAASAARRRQVLALHRAGGIVPLQGISELPREEQDEATRRLVDNAIAMLSIDHPTEHDNSIEAVRATLPTSENVDGNRARDEAQRNPFSFLQYDRGLSATRPVGGPRSLDAHMDSGRLLSTNNNHGGTAPRSVDGRMVDQTVNSTEIMQFHLEVGVEIGSIHVHDDDRISEYSGMGGVDSVNLNRRRNNNDDEVSVRTENVHVLEGSEIEVNVDDCSEVTIDATFEENSTSANVDNNNEDTGLVHRSVAGDPAEAQGAINGANNDGSDSVSTSMPSLHPREVSPTSSDSSDRSFVDAPEEDTDHPSLPPLAPRDDSSSDDSMPRFTRRVVESTSSNDSRTNPHGYDDDDEDDDTLPPLTSSNSVEDRMLDQPLPPLAPELRLRNSLEARYSEIFTSLQSNAFRRPERPSTMPSQQRNNNDGFKYLRDYGAMKVFASATCPICLDDHDVLVSLKCGHCLCMEDFRELGGYLASEKDKLLAEENVTVVNDDNAARQAS